MHSTLIITREVGAYRSPTSHPVGVRYIGGPRESYRTSRSDAVSLVATRYPVVVIRTNAPYLIDRVPTSEQPYSTRQLPVLESARTVSVRPRRLVYNCYSKISDYGPSRPANLNTRFRRKKSLM